MSNYNRITDQELLDISDWIIQKGASIRVVSEHFGFPASSIWYRLNHRLQFLDPSRYQQVRDILDSNSRHF